MRNSLLVILAFCGLKAFGDPALSIEKTYVLPFPVDVVYQAWVSSDTVIPPATEMDIDPRVGGHYRLIMKTPEFEGRNEGEFLLVEPNQRVRYTWEWNGDGEVSIIDVAFVATQHGTQITLQHTGFSKPESVAAHDSGWDSYVAGLKALLSGRSN